jgi:hypothetical protein
MVIMVMIAAYACALERIPLIPSMYALAMVLAMLLILALVLDNGLVSIAIFLFALE